MTGRADSNEYFPTRRKLLGLIGSGTAGYLSSGLVLENSNGVGSDPESFNSSQHESLYDSYPENQVDKLDYGAKNVIFDFHYVEGEILDDEHVESIETVFQDAGVNAKVLENETVLTEDEFHEHRPVDRELLVNESSLWSEYTEDFMKDTAIQVYFVPGKKDKPNRGELKTFDQEGDARWLEGLTYASENPRSVVSFDSPYRVKGAVHELGHAMGLRHTEDETDIMYVPITEETELGFDEKQSETMNSNI